MNESNLIYRLLVGLLQISKARKCQEFLIRSGEVKKY